MTASTNEIAPALDTLVRRGSRSRRALVALALATLVFAAVAPTLTWLPFCNGVENLNVVTALEIRRGGPWLIPTLQGEPRVRKPPLAAWVTAASSAPRTVEQLSSPDPARRDAARSRLAWQARGPVTVIVSLTVGAAYLLGAAVLGDAGAGSVACALVAASSVLFFRFARFAATDAHLALWVTAANLCIAKLIFERRHVWPYSVAAGAALGLGFMSKGPVALAMTVVPALVFLLWDRTRRADREPRQPGSSHAAPVAAGAVVMLVVGLSWFAYVLAHHPGQLDRWWLEVMRTDPSEADRGKWHHYFMILPMMAPWTALLAAAIAYAARTLWRRGDAGAGVRLGADELRRLAYALALLAAPLLVMSCFRDRKVRYLFPLAVPAGVLVAALLPHLFRTRAALRSARLLLSIHWATLGVIAVGFPVAGAMGVVGMRRLDGAPWFAPAQGAIGAIVGAVLVVAGVIASRARPYALVAATAAVMLLAQAAFVHGMRGSEGGRAEMRPLADAIWRRCPDAIAYDVNDGRKRIPPELAIYLNRVTRQAASVASIPRDAGGTPQVYVALQRRGALLPEPAPGWTLFARVPRNDKDEWWVAFVRDLEAHDGRK